MGLIKGKQIAAGTIANDRLTNGSTYLRSGGGGFPMTVDMDLGNFKIVNLAPGVSGTDAANINQVNAAAGGLDPQDSCRVATTVALTTWTAAGGPGPGKTLTSPNDNISNNVFDGVTVALGDRVLVKDGGPNANVDNGIYTVTQLADGAGTNAELTRATGFDESSEITQGAYTLSVEGTVNAGVGWVITTIDPISVDVTAIVWTQFSVAPNVLAGAGLVQNGNALDVNDGDGIGIGGTGTDFVIAKVAVATVLQQFGAIVNNRNADGSGAGATDDGYLAVQTDNSTVRVNSSNQVGVPAGGITETELNTSVAGPGLIGAGGSALEVNDGVGLEIVTDLLRLAAQGNGIDGGAGSLLSVKPDVTTGGAIVPVNVVANGVGLDLSSIDGNGIVVVGSELAINLAAAGGLQIAADALGILHNITTSPTQPEPSTASDAGGLWAATPVTSNKDQSPTPTSGDNSPTGLTLVDKIIGYLRVLVNGVAYQVGDGVKTKDCYLSVDAGVTALAFNAMQVGAALFWNGIIVGFDLAADDQVDMEGVAL